MAFSLVELRCRWQLSNPVWDYSDNPFLLLFEIPLLCAPWLRILADRGRHRRWRGERPNGGRKIAGASLSVEGVGMEEHSEHSATTLAPPHVFRTHSDRFLLAVAFIIRKLLVVHVLTAPQEGHMIGGGRGVAGW